MEKDSLAEMADALKIYKAIKKLSSVEVGHPVEPKFSIFNGSVSRILKNMRKDDLTEELKIYEKLANIMADEKTNFNLSVESPKHIKITYKTLIKKSRINLQIVADKLDNESYTNPETISCFKEAIQNGLDNINIIFDNQGSKNKAISEKFLEFAYSINNKKNKEIFNIYILDKEYHTQKYFCISDGLRIGTKYNNTVNFNDPEKANKLSEEYKNLMNHVIKIYLYNPKRNKLSEKFEKLMDYVKKW